MPEEDKDEFVGVGSVMPLLIVVGVGAAALLVLAVIMLGSNP